MDIGHNRPLGPVRPTGRRVPRARSAESVPTSAAASGGPPASPHSKGVGSAFQCRATASNQSMISCGFAGCCPSNARRFNTRWMLSAMFSQEPPTGVYTGMIPWANNHSTNSGVLWPARLSSTNSIRKDGNSSGRVGLTASPACHRRHAARDARASAVGTGQGGQDLRQLRASANGWSTALEQVVTLSIRTRPSAGWKQRQHLGGAVADILCGWRAGSPSGRQALPGMRHGLERTCLVAAPDRQAQRLAQTRRRPQSSFWARRPGP